MPNNKPIATSPLTDEETFVLLEEARQQIIQRAQDEDRPLTEDEQKALDEIDKARNEIIDEQIRKENENLTGEEIDERDGVRPPRAGGSGGSGSDGGGQGGGSGGGSGGDDPGGDDPGGDDPGGDDPGGDEARADGGDDNPHEFNLGAILAARRATGIPAGLLEQLRARLPGGGVTDPPENAASEGDDDNPKSRRTPIGRISTTHGHSPVPKPIRTAHPQSDPRVTDPNPSN